MRKWNFVISHLVGISGLKTEVIIIGYIKILQNRFIILSAMWRCLLNCNLKFLLWLYFLIPKL